MTYRKAFQTLNIREDPVQILLENKGVIMFFYVKLCFLIIKSSSPYFTAKPVEIGYEGNLLLYTKTELNNV